MKDTTKGLFIDQVFSGFDPADPAGSAARFCATRRAVLDDPAIHYVLEFPECCVDTYENLVAYEPGAACEAQRSIQLWGSARAPGSCTYWSATEFAALTAALRGQGVSRIMVRTFLTFEGRTGSGRFLREFNTPHTAAFEWRRADEFLRCHPEIRDARTHLLNWDAPVVPDPLRRIPEGMTVGGWFTRQLFGFLGSIGVNAVRLGDGSAGGRLWKGRPEGSALCRRLHEAMLGAARKEGFWLLTSLGPYWSFDAWRDELGIRFSDLPHLADALLTQPLECWTDRYGLTYPHNGEYFNAGCGRLHALVNAVAAPHAVFVRGLDAGDAIENWHPPETMPLRETCDARLLFSRRGNRLEPAYQGVYHFWSDELSPTYYRRQQELHDFLAGHPPAACEGPVLVVTGSRRPHAYTMADFFETCGYGLQVSCSSADATGAAGPYVHFLPRLPGSEPVLDEDELAREEAEEFVRLLEGPEAVIVFGGARDERFLKAFGVRLAGATEAFIPREVSAAGQTRPWFDRAEAADYPGMAGQPERFKRRHELLFEADGAEVLASVRDGAGTTRVLATRYRAPSGGWRILLTGLPDEAARACGAAVVAETCGLDYRVTSDASVSSVSWRDAAGARFLAVFRYDRIQATPAVVKVETRCGVVRVCMASASEYTPSGLLTMAPQGFVILQLGAALD